MNSSSDPMGEPAEGSGASLGGNHRALRVLVVDDHLLTRCRTRQQIEDISGIQVIGEATDGFEAVALARTLLPDLILMDIAMPALDGIEATRRISSECPRIRIIMLSAYDGESFQRSARDAGAHAYVVKGESTKRLAGTIEEVFRNR
jgi:DNA-binding NarL/FixJ family response regulator